MKTVIYLFLSFLLFISLMGCGKETPDVPVPRDSYDISNPGLSDEEFGEVKWIFSLKYGESKTLDINGESYTITLADVANNLHGAYPDLWKGAFYAYLDINQDTVVVTSISVFEYKQEQEIADLRGGRILFIYDFLKEVFAYSNAIAQTFEGNFGYGSLINSYLEIYIDVCFYRILSDKDGASVNKDADIIFMIIERR